MMKKRLSKTLWYGTDVDSYGNPIIPSFTADQHDLDGLHVGELFLHYSDGIATLWTANESGDVVKISGGEGGVDLSKYLLISEFNKIWEIRTDSQGAEYIFGKLPVVSQYGITMYAQDENIDIPTIAEGLPFDQTTIWYNPETNRIEVIGGTGGGTEGDTLTKEEIIEMGFNLVSEDVDEAIQELDEEYATKGYVDKAIGSIGSGVADSISWENVNDKPSWITDTKPSYSYDEISGTPDLSVYATGSDLSSLTAIVGEKADKATTLSGYGITDAYTKTKVDELLDNYAALNEDQTIEGKTDFTGGLLVNGGEIKYDKENGCWKLEGDLLVTGGVTMCSDNNVGVSNEVLQSLLDRISALEAEVERLKNK